MPRRLVALVLVLVCLAGMAAACRGEEPLTVLGYLGQRAEQIAAQLPPLPDKAADWEKRRAEMLEQLSTVLGLPQREPMKAAVLGQKEEGDLVVEQVIYLWAERAYVAGNVIRKKDLSGRAPAIVVPPGWLGHYTWPCYKEFVFHMARQGYLVLFIDDPHIGKRAAPYAGLYAVASAAGTPVMGIQVFDTLRGLDYLMTRPDVDPGRIGVAGLCQGAEQTWLAAALDPQFQYAVPVCGTTTYAAWAAMPAVDGVALSDPSPYVAGILRVTEWDEIGAAIAPRPVFIASNSGDNWWPPAGYDKVVATMTKAYAMQNAADRFRQLRELRSHDMTPFLPELAPWIDAQTKALAASSAAPLPCGEPEEPDCSMLRAMQRRIAAQTAPFAASLDSPAAWEAHRAQIAKWLAQACDFQGMKPAESLVKGTAEKDGLVVESLSLGVDADFFCPATLVHAAAPASGPRAAVILSHDDGQCMGSPRILAATQRLASLGYWVIVPEHASLNQASLQRAESRGLVSLYGAGDTVGLPPVALRVADDLAALRYLASRPEVDPQQIVAVGAGVGGIDAALSALVDPRIAAVAAVDVTTARDWAATVAPDLLWVTHVMPYLPGLLSKTDWDYCFGALAPRPLVLVEQKDGWPKSGFEQAVATATAAYRLSGAEKSLLALGSRDVTEDLENGTPEGLLKPLVAAARTLVPQPPPPGMIGTLDGLRSRETVDSATGIVWLVSVMDAYDQQFVDGGYRLQSWSFYNDNGAAQQGRSATPLIFKKEGDAFVLTGIGKTRVNTGGGMQTFPFEVTAGSDEVGKGYYFGWHDGDQAGTANAGVVEFDNSVQDRMSIVTLDGQLGDQKLQLGGKYRIQSEYPRTYSIQAVSKRP